MRQYPSIDRAIRKKLPIIAFDKLDGSNVRVEWTPKKGWVKFGRRHGLLDSSNPLLEQKVPKLILDKYGDELARIFRQQRWRRAVPFFEFYGPSSFAGNHDPDEEHTVTLLDVIVFQKGLLEPRTFLDLFGHLDVPGVVYRGRVGNELQQTIFEGALPGVTFEGVVCKGAKVKNRPVMFKVKSKAWYDRLRTRCDGNTALFDQLR